jgi:hypothetical protein
VQTVARPAALFDRLCDDSPREQWRHRFPLA